MSNLVTRTFAEALTKVELPLASASVTRHIRVFDSLALSPYITLEGELVDGHEPLGDDRLEIGGYVVISRDKSTWDAVVEALEELESTQPEYFHRLMRQCVGLSNGAREADGFHNLLDDDEQAALDLADARDIRREEAGYVTPADARAFLEAARRMPPEAPGPQRSGIVPLTTPAFGLVREFIESHADTEIDLAFLANALISGCSIQGRAFAVQESRDAALALCNLGFESWPAAREDRTLRAAFQIGLAFLHHNVCMRSARRLLDAAAEIQCSDRYIQFDLAVLRRELRKALSDGRPWTARNALDVVMILDTPAWGTLVGLTDQCPVFDGQLISSSRQLASVYRFLDTLSSALMS